MVAEEPLVLLMAVNFHANKLKARKLQNAG